ARAGRGFPARGAGACRAAGQRRAGPPGAGACAAGRQTGGRAPRAPRGDPMKLAFTKMEGTGNDFVVLDFTNRDFSLSPEQIRTLSDRHFGVGADQVLVVEKPGKPGFD